MSGIEMTVESVEVHAEPLERLKSRLRRLGARAVVVGWPSDSPLHKERKADGTVTTNPSVTVAQVAAIHEFGSASGRIPARPILGETYRLNLKGLVAKMQYLAGKYVLEDEGEESALKELGEYYAMRVKMIFLGVPSAPNWPPLAPSTVSRKNSSDILIDTWHLQESVRWLIVGEGYK